MIESILLTTYQTQFFHKFMRALNVLLKRSESIKTLVREKDSLALLRSSNLEALAIVLDNTALEAARRYQWFILEHTDKGWHSNYDIFAGIGAERALAHVLCNQSEVNEALLLKGLVVDDVDSLGALIDDASIVNEAFHRRDGGGSPVKQAQRAACSDAYTKLGQMPEGYNPYWATIDKNDLGDYSSFIDHWGNTRPSLLKFISGRRGYVVERLFYLGGAEEDWDLTVFNFKGADFSNTVFNQCVFAGSLDGVRFNRSYLRRANLSAVSLARNAKFNHAHIEYCSARDVDFRGGEFDQAHCQFGDFTAANLKECSHKQTKWYGAIVERVILSVAGDSCEPLLQREAAGNVGDAMSSEEIRHQLEQVSGLEKAIEQLESIRRNFSLSDDVLMHRDSRDKNPQQAFNADIFTSLLDLSREMVREKMNRSNFERLCRDAISMLEASYDRPGDGDSAERDQWQARLDHLEAKQKGFEPMEAALCAKVNEACAHITANTSQIGDLQQKISLLTCAFHGLVAKSDRAYDDLQAKVNVVSDRQEVTEGRVAALSADHSDLAADHEATKERVSALEGISPSHVTLINGGGCASFTYTRSRGMNSFEFSEDRVLRDFAPDIRREIEEGALPRANDGDASGPMVMALDPRFRGHAFAHETDTVNRFSVARGGIFSQNQGPAPASHEQSSKEALGCEESAVTTGSKALPPPSSP